MSYFFATATKVELVESEDSQYPDKFKIEIDRKKHKKWVAENLSNLK